MRRRWTARVSAIVIGAVMLATITPVAVMPAAGSAAPYAVKEGRLYQPVQSTGSAFGWSVDISGDTLVVGAPWYNSDTGAAYVYVRSGGVWSHQATLQAPTPAAGDEFGHSVAIDGNVIIVGAPYDVTASGPSGAAYAFRRTGFAWSAGSALPVEGMDHNGWRIGQSVDIAGNWAVVGCPGRDSSRGGVLPIEWTGSGWDSHSGVTLTGGSAAGDLLGSSVAIAGGIIMAGSPGDSYDPYTAAGSVSVYSWSGSAWLYDDKVFCPDARNNGNFAGPIDLNDSGTLAIVGWPWYDATPGDGTYAGRAYLLHAPLGDWQLLQTIPNPNPDSPDGEHFGSGVALDDHTALVGGFWDDAHVGAAYFYTQEAAGFTQAQKVTVTDEPLMTLYFGRSVALDNGTAVIGADGSSSPTVSNCGATLVYNANMTITGVCRDAATGLPLAGVEVQLHRQDAGGDPTPASDYVVSGADGRYTIIAPSGLYYLNWLAGPGYQPGWYNDAELWPEASPFAVWAGNTYTIDLTVYPVGKVFRFYNKKVGTHFYTNSVSEKKNILAKWPDIFTYEGIAYCTDPATELYPLYRFYNRTNGSHFYTASPAEADHVIATWPNIYQYDGPTYAVTPFAVAGKSPVYRFYNRTNGSHFYTASPAEADHVIATWPNIYQYEGIAFWIGKPAFG